VPALSGSIERRQQRPAGRQLELDASRLLPESDQVAVVACPEGATRQSEVDRLEQVRLSGAVRPVDDDDVRRDLRTPLYEIAEAAALDGPKDHGVTRSGEWASPDS
jgi:hypothetical protein